jgi:hypothetical protein
VSAVKRAPDRVARAAADIASAQLLQAEPRFVISSKHGLPDGATVSGHHQDMVHWHKKPSFALPGVRKRKKRILGSAAAVIVIFAAGTAPAHANPFGTCNTNVRCIPDAGDHTYCFESSMTSAFQYHATNSMSYVAAYTIYGVAKIGCSGVTDVRFAEANLGSATRGDYSCLLLTLANNCETSKVRLNPVLLTDGNNRRKTACHEVGHSLGLAHGGTTDCMLSGPVSTSVANYTAHHIAHINSRKVSAS